MTKSPSAVGPSGAVGTNVRNLRSGLGWSQADLAERASRGPVVWDQTAVSQVERGRRRVTVAQVLELAHALSVPPVVLLLPPDGQRLDVAGHAVPRDRARAWITGRQPLNVTPNPHHYREAVGADLSSRDAVPGIGATMVALAEMGGQVASEDLAGQHDAITTCIDYLRGALRAVEMAQTNSGARRASRSEEGSEK